MSVNNNPTYYRKWRLSKKISPRIRAAICEARANGQTITEICDNKAFPGYPALQRLIRADRDFAEEWGRASELFWEKQADMMLNIADDSRNDYVQRRRNDGSTVTVLDKEAVMRSSLRVETRKWMISKMLPKIYGTKSLDAETAGQIIGDVKDIIREVVSVARDPRPVVEAEVLEVKEIADAPQGVQEAKTQE